MNNLFQNEPIKSISFDQDEIIASILHLHTNNKRIDVDATYSKGNFYTRKIQQPKYKFDINPQVDGVVQADARSLPLENNSVETIMFDPPFLTGKEKVSTGKIKNRFGWYETYQDLWKFYKDALKEFYRILKTNGIVIFKCQDYVNGGKQHFSHVVIMNIAVEIGYYPKDLFIYLVKSRMYQEKDILNQEHARKYHSYFWVFQKKNCPIDYKNI